MKITITERGTLAEGVRKRENWTEKGSLRHNDCSEEESDGGGGRRAEKRLMRLCCYWQETY